MVFSRDRHAKTLPRQRDHVFMPLDPPIPGSNLGPGPLHRVIWGAADHSVHTVQIKKENTGPMLAVSEIFDYCIMSIFVVATALQSDTEPLTCLVFFWPCHRSSITLSRCHQKLSRAQLYLQRCWIWRPCRPRRRACWVSAQSSSLSRWRAARPRTETSAPHRGVGADSLPPGRPDPS